MTRNVRSKAVGGITLGIILYVILYHLKYYAFRRISRDTWNKTQVDQMLDNLHRAGLAVPEDLASTMIQKKAESMTTLISMDDFDSVFYKVNIFDEIASAIVGLPMDPLPGFKNPCWISSVDPKNPYDQNPRILRRGNRYTDTMIDIFKSHVQSPVAWRMRCFPYAMLLGVTKCGTTDLFDRLASHPEIIKPMLKEPRYWNRHRVGHPTLAPPMNLTFTQYLDFFDEAAHQIWTDKDAGDDVYRRDITMDGTPHYLWDYEGWEQTPGNIGLSEPKYILAHSLYSIKPDLKFVVILRNPTTRLYSHFRMLSSSAPSAIFHELVVTALELWNQCIQHSTIRSCAYNASILPFEYSHPGGVILRAGLYPIFLNDWFSVFPREQFYILKAEEYYGDMTSGLQQVYQFLDVSPLSDVAYSKINEGKVKNANSNKKVSNTEPMFESTKRLLDDFYRPFNEKLADLLGDKFLWDDS